MRSREVGRKVAAVHARNEPQRALDKRRKKRPEFSGRFCFESPIEPRDELAQFEPR